MVKLCCDMSYVLLADETMVFGGGRCCGYGEEQSGGHRFAADVSVADRSCFQLAMDAHMRYLVKLHVRRFFHGQLT